MEERLRGCDVVGQSIALGFGVRYGICMRIGIVCNDEVARRKS